jgi:hypothetical protein
LKIKIISGLISALLAVYIITIFNTKNLDNISFDPKADTDFKNNFVNIPRQNANELGAKSYYNNFFEIPSVKLKAPIEKIDLSNNKKISPPDVKSIYFLSDFGNPYTKNSGLSIFITHSVWKGLGAGNFLYDDISQAKKVDIGDIILLTDRTSGILKKYEIKNTQIFERADLQKEQKIWSKWKNRDNELVLITCWNEPNVNWSKSNNFVIFAKLV